MPTNVPDLAATIVNVTSSLTIEWRERERHQLNLILHNALESKSSEPNIRKREDVDFASQPSQMFLALMLLMQMQLDLERENRDRLLKITVESLDQKKAILRNIPHLQAFHTPKERTKGKQRPKTQMKKSEKK